MKTAQYKWTKNFIFLVKKLGKTPVEIQALERQRYELEIRRYKHLTRVRKNITIKVPPIDELLSSSKTTVIQKIPLK